MSSRVAVPFTVVVGSKAPSQEYILYQGPAFGAADAHDAAASASSLPDRVCSYMYCRN